VTVSARSASASGPGTGRCRAEPIDGGAWLPQWGPMLFSIEGKTALVTGGSRGIGQMISSGLVDAGASVFITARTAEAGRAAADELAARGTCEPLVANLSTEAGCIGLAEAVASKVDRLHILVNNAGANWAAPLAEFDDAAWDRVLSLNVKAVFHLTKALLPLLEAASTPEDPARVINIGSIDGLRVPSQETYAYSASKAAVHMLTRHLARTLAPSVTVNAIAPGPFESKMMAETLRLHGDEIVARAPLGRIGRPDDLAGTTIFLASRAGSHLTGAVIPVDGGTAMVGT
jgi:NAD(P)-dependent dehydrogenase (short-subunit alcohol dehydrogenase family)